jgi:hypothetical protein
VRLVWRLGEAFHYALRLLHRVDLYRFGRIWRWRRRRWLRSLPHIRERTMSDQEKPFHPSQLEWAPAKPVSDEDLIRIARIILNWGLVDLHLGNALIFLYKVEPGDRGDLLNVLDVRKKVDLISKRVKSMDHPDEIRALTKEIHHCLSHYKAGRDVVAHGVIMWGADGEPSFVSPRTYQLTELTELPRVLERSRYACNAAINIFKFFAGLPREPLPDRPP